MTNLAKLPLIFAWVSGIVLANGFWSTMFAVFFPFWAWYLTVEMLLKHFGMI